MGRNDRKRRTPLATKAIAASAALALGGGGLLWAQMNASAHESNSGQNETKAATAAAQVATIACPDVGQQLTNVPQKARQGVATELANLDKQITEAYARLASTRQAQANDASFVQNAIVGPLKEKRAATIDRIRIDIQRVGGTVNATALKQLAACTTQNATNTTTAGRGGGRGNGGGKNNGGGQNTAAPSASASASASAAPPANNGGQAGNGPTAADFVDITKVANNVLAKPQNSGQASTGSFTTKCGVNANKNHNTDNVIVAPGVTNGAHHQHDYVGNQKVNAFSTNDSLLAAPSSCQNQSDLSAYYWPVVRVQDGSQEFDANALGGGKEGNVGKILTPAQAQIKYVGSPASKVVAMPQFLRIITGDAKTLTNGLANANAHWSCTGFENKVQLTEQYPICPQGSQVVRLPELLGRREHRQRQPPYARGLRGPGERSLRERLQGHPAADDAPGLQHHAPHPPGGRHGEERLRGRRFPGAAAQGFDRPRRLHQRHQEQPGGDDRQLRQLRQEVLVSAASR
jgi:hypothetical protein